MIISWCSNSFSFAVLVVVRAQQSQQQQAVVTSSSTNMNLRGLASEDFVSNVRENNGANRSLLLGTDRKTKNKRDKQNQDDDDKNNNNHSEEEEKIRSENKKRKEVNEKLREKAALKDKLAREKKDGEKKQEKQQQQQKPKQKKDKKEKDNADKKKGKTDDDKKKDKKNKKDNEEDKKKPNKQSATLSTTPNKGKKDQNNDNGKNDDSKKPSKKDNDDNSGKVQPNAPTNQGHGDKPSKKDKDAASSSQESSVVVYGRNKLKSVNALTDSSIPLDSFEEDDDGNTNFDLFEWTSTSRNPWIPSSQHAHDGKSSMVSGITSLVYDQGPSGGGSQTVYSNLTLSTDSNFNGGVLTFRLLAKSLALPRESFFVMVDGNIELNPEEVITRSSSSSSTLAANTWAEYSVPVGRGEHKVTWVHAYNPFALKVLPSVGGDVDVGLWMDDLRLVPFTSIANLDPLEVINGGGGISSPWEVSKDGSTIVASSSDVQGNRGSANIQFELYSKMGAMLTYRVKTSTSGPHDDFAILFNNDVVATTMFGDMLGFESRSLAIPKGKVVVTLSHRKNPGRLDRTLLESLGEIGTEGRTWLESLSLNIN